MKITRRMIIDARCGNGDSKVIEAVGYVDYRYGKGLEYSTVASETVEYIKKVYDQEGRE